MKITIKTSKDKFEIGSLKEAISKYTKTITEHKSIGCLDSRIGQIQLADASHIVKSIDVNSVGDTEVEIIPLTTPRGNLLSELLSERKDSVEFSINGFGKRDKHCIVQLDEIISINARLVPTSNIQK